jgi:hypothetical protein
MRVTRPEESRLALPKQIHMRTSLLHVDTLKLAWVYIMPCCPKGVPDLLRLVVLAKTVPVSEVLSPRANHAQRGHTTKTLLLTSETFVITIPGCRRESSWAVACARLLLPSAGTTNPFGVSLQEEDCRPACTYPLSRSSTSGCVAHSFPRSLSQPCQASLRRSFWP